MKALTTALFVAMLLTGCAPGEQAETAGTSGKTLGLIKAWVKGNYNNVAQFEADMAAGLPPERTHRPMHQLFVPMEAPLIDGYIVYQQSSMDGSENPAMIFRHGLLQFLPVENTDVVIQRELYFKDPEQYKNLHHNPEMLTNVSLDQMTWNENCDFHIEANAAGDKVSGPLPGRCIMINRGTQQEMYADDFVEITATDFRFRGRYVDADGNTVWGTESDELNSLTRQ